MPIYANPEMEENHAAAVQVQVKLVVVEETRSRCRCSTFRANFSEWLGRSWSWSSWHWHWLWLWDWETEAMSLVLELKLKDCRDDQELNIHTRRHKLDLNSTSTSTRSQHRFYVINPTKPKPKQIRRVSLLSPPSIAQLAAAHTQDDSIVYVSPLAAVLTVTSSACAFICICLLPLLLLQIDHCTNRNSLYLPSRFEIK